MCRSIEICRLHQTLTATQTQAKDNQDASSALRAHALADISSPAGSMPEGTTQSALQAHAPSAQDQQHSSEASGVEDSSPEASVTGRSAAGFSKGDAEEGLSEATSYTSAAHDTLPDSAGDAAEPHIPCWLHSCMSCTTVGECPRNRAASRRAWHDALGKLPLADGRKALCR